MRRLRAGVLLAGTLVSGLAAGLPEGAGGTPAGLSPSRESCAACHAFPAELSHPLGVRAPAGTGLPADASGRIACATCHEDCGSAAIAGAGRAGPRLRMPARELCAACHRVGGGSSAAGASHALARFSAHGRSGSGRADHAAAPSAGGLDDESRGCLGCHDGVTAATARIRVGPADGAARSMPWDALEDHPVGTPYPGAGGGGGSRFRPRGSLPAQIRLPGGTVGCVSCHSMYSREPKLLALPAEGSRLCFACHRM